MDVDQLLKQVDHYQSRLFVVTKDGLEPADPVTLSKNLFVIRNLLVELSNKASDIELDYRRAKAARFDRFVKDGMKRSPAFDALEMEPDLIEKKIAAERLRNYLKYMDGLCTSIQSVLKVQSGSDKSQY